MKTVSALILLAGSVTATTDEEWQVWKQAHGREYEDEEEENYRRAVFNDNMVRAVELQQRNPLAQFGATKFSDWTPLEFKQTLLTYRPANLTLPDFDISSLPSPTESAKDWTGIGTTPVKDQKSCGSCWAFSATEQIESDLILQHGKKVELAPQQLVDCRKGGKNFRFGCTGGNTDKAFDVIESMGGMDTEADYKYTGWSTSVCRFKKDKAAAKVTGYSLVGKSDESAMKSYVLSTGPLSVCVAAGAWHSYQGGILTDCDTNVDHCVQVVGYGESPTPYWKVRNSWNTNFGEQGHIRLAYGTNLCQVASEPRKTTVEPLGGVVV